MVFYPEISITIGLIGISLILFVISSISGFLVSLILIERVRTKINREKHTFRKTVYRPLELAFLLFIFVATVFITFAMKYHGLMDLDSIQNYMMYWSLAIFFYVSSVTVGFAHYVRGIYVKR